MSWLRRLLNTFRRARLDAEIDDEQRFHLAMRAADLERKGASAPEARRQARMLFGNTASLRDRTRESDLWVGIDTALQDVRFAIRLLWRTPVFTGTASLTVALGVAVLTAVFGVLYGVVIRPLPYVEPDRLFQVFQKNERAGRTRVAPLDFVDLRNRSRTFTMAGVAGTGFTLTDGGDPELVIGQLVSENFFSLLGVQPALGRAFGASERDSDVVVLSHALWLRRFGGDPGIVGRAIGANGRSYTVIGVMPAGFSYQAERYELWVPLPLRSGNPFNLPITRTSRFVQVLARLNPGFAPDTAVAELATISAALAREYPDSHANSSFVISSLIEETVGDIRPALQLLFVAAVLVLLIACANVTSLLLARFSVRAPEVVTRAALGATRLRLVRQFMVETLVLYVAGTGAGVLIASVLLAVVQRFGASIPRIGDVALFGPVVAFACVTSLTAALVFGVAPAWQATRPTAASWLRARAATTNVADRRFRSTIVVAQVAVALCLLSGASLVTRSLMNLHSVEKGFDPTGRITFNFVMPAPRFPTPESVKAFHLRVLDALEARPELSEIGTTTHLPLSGQDLENGFAVDGYVPPSADLEPIAAVRGVSPGYTAAMGIALRAGRGIAPSDDERGAPVALVNEAFARKYFEGRSAVGGRVSAGGGEPWRTVVGVVADVKHRGLAAEARPEVLIPYVQMAAGLLTSFARGNSVVIRTELDSAAAAGLVRQQMRRLDPNIPVIGSRPMTDLVAESTAEPRFRSLLLASFALTALCLAAVGIFGLLSYLVSERTREFGIRMALGADPETIFRQVLANGVRLIASGAILGLAGGALLTRWIRGLLFQVSPADPMTIGIAVLCLTAIALAATLVPAWRATRIDPVNALRA